MICYQNVYHSNVGWVRKVFIQAKWPIRVAGHLAFLSVKQLLKYFLFPSGWDASPSQGYPQRYPFIHLGGELLWE